MKKFVIFVEIFILLIFIIYHSISKVNNTRNENSISLREAYYIAYDAIHKENPHALLYHMGSADTVYNQEEKTAGKSGLRKYWNLDFAVPNATDHWIVIIRNKRVNHDDKSKCKPPENDVPEWYNGGWYIGLGILNENEVQRIIENYGRYLIMLDDTAIGGFWVHSENKNTLFLDDFCILPKYQGRGYGTRTLYLLEQKFPSYLIII